MPKHTGRFIGFLGLGLGAFSATVWWMKVESIPAYLVLIPPLGAFLVGWLLTIKSKNIFAQVWGIVVSLAAMLSQAVSVTQELWWAVPLLILLSGVVFSRHAGSGLGSLASFLFGMVGLGLLLSPVVSVQYLVYIATVALMTTFLGFMYSGNYKYRSSDRVSITLAVVFTSLVCGAIFYILSLSIDHQNYNAVWITSNLGEALLIVLTLAYLAHLVYKYFFVDSFEESVKAASRFYWEVIDLFIPIKGEGEKK